MLLPGGGHGAECISDPRPDRGWRAIRQWDSLAGPSRDVLEGMLKDSPPVALVIAHPGHELRIHGWLAAARPLVFILTDGSGHTGRSRLAATSAILAACGARPGCIYGRMTDAELYRALLDGRFEVFSGLAEELAAALRQESVALVAGDAAEGFNPGHDVTRLLVNAAVARLRVAGGPPIDNRDFPLHGAPAERAARDGDSEIRLELDPAALARKLAAARSYPGLEDEVESALARFGVGAFATECLREVRYGLAIDDLIAHPPAYEAYGEERVAAGIYREVLRHRSHVAPLAEGLRAWSTAVVSRVSGVSGASGIAGTAEIAGTAASVR